MTQAQRKKFTFRKFVRAREGATAIEFALLAIPFFMVIFAILETFIAMISEQVLASATDTVARRIRTGQITQTITPAQLRQMMCEEISVIMTCTPTEVAQPAKLYIDLRSVDTFTQLPTQIPIKTNGTARDLDTAQLLFTPGGAGKVHMLRVYYRWPVMTDLVRPFITNIRPADGSMPSHFLIVATNVFVTEEN